MMINRKSHYAVKDKIYKQIQIFIRTTGYGMKKIVFLHCSKGYEAICQVNNYDSDL
jgi:hypothetical protein